METVNRLVLKFRVNKIQVPGIYGPIILCEFLNHLQKTNAYSIKEGYLKIETNDKPEVCWHLWVENEEGEKFDINKLLAERNDEEFSVCDFEYMDSVDESVKPEDIYKEWELYQKDKKEFWKKSPMKLKNFRSKLFNNKK